MSDHNLNFAIINKAKELLALEVMKRKPEWYQEQRHPLEDHEDFNEFLYGAKRIAAYNGEEIIAADKVYKETIRPIYIEHLETILSLI